MWFQYSSLVLICTCNQWMKTQSTEVLKVSASDSMGQIFILCNNLKWSSQHFGFFSLPPISAVQLLFFKITLYIPPPCFSSPRNIPASCNSLVPQRYTYGQKSSGIHSELQHLISGWLSRDRFTVL